MDSAQGKEYQVARIALAAKVEFLPAAMSFIRDIATKLGLTSEEAGRLELAVEEACVNAIEHAFEPGEQGSFEIIVLRKPGQVAVAVEDQGLPFDIRRLETGRESSLGVTLMKAFADEIHFLNLGRRGKRVELAKNLSYQDVDAYVSAEEKERVPLASVAPLDTPITIRLMIPDDSINLARCVYRCYGYTYSSDHVYFPDRVRELLEGGLLTAYIALAPDGEIVGHVATRKEHAKARIGEAGQAIVDPRFRGRGLLNKMGTLLLERNQKDGMYGNYAEMVTVHPYSQQAAISQGWYETGVLLGFTPATVFFRDIHQKDEPRRRAAVLFYKKVNEGPQRDVYAPFHHQTMIHRIYEISKLNRNIINALDVKESPAVSPASQIDIKVQVEASRAFMRVTQYGADLEQLVKFRLQELCLRRIDCIYLDLPLSHPAIQKFCAAMELLGFFFGGIMPEMLDGDVLRLQYLNNVPVDIEQIKVASDFGKELLNYVLKAKEA